MMQRVDSLFGDVAERAVDPMDNADDWRVRPGEWPAARIRSLILDAGLC